MIAGRYSLEREVGRGGMGAVWLARDEVLGRPVAVKRLGLLPGSTSPDAARAEREARLAAKLNHPYVVAVFDLVQDEADTWLVMEYVDGKSLAERLRHGGAMTGAQALPIITQCADALLAAHREGIVHRDVKPSNIMLSRAGEAKLTDFGIARAAADPSLTQTGLVTGSPAYLAPEVASGRTATPASDVWSLGATLFHCLAGRPPYDVGDNLLGGLYTIVHEEPPRLPGAGMLAPVLEGTMVRDPDDRWSMEEVLAHLRGLHADESATQLMTTVAPPAVAPARATSSRPTHAADHPRRRSPVLPWLLGGAALLLVAVIGGALLMSGDDAPPAQDRGASASARDTGSASPSRTGSTSESPTGSPAESPSQSTSAAETRAAMDSFVSDYLATAPTDSRKTFSQLTRAFQAASGGYAGYNGFWGGVASATVQSVTSDPETLVVRYRVQYVMEDGRRVSDDVQLQLVRSGNGFLIDGEA